MVFSALSKNFSRCPNCVIADALAHPHEKYENDMNKITNKATTGYFEETYQSDDDKLTGWVGSIHSTNSLINCEIPGSINPGALRARSPTIANADMRTPAVSL